MIAAVITVSLLSLSQTECGEIPERHERQRSPISLDTVIASPSWSRQDALRFEYGSRPAAIDCRDHHGYWEIRMNGEQKLHVAYLNETFVLQQFHMHWGDTVDQAGSEHVLNGRRSTAEIHFVHRNVRYATMKEALGKPAGLAVLGVLIDAVGPDEMDPREKINNQRVDNQFWVLADLMRGYGSRSKLDRLRYLWRIDPMALIPDSSPFLHYTGSLTFNERGPVEWIVFERPEGIPDLTIRSANLLCYPINKKGIGWIAFERPLRLAFLYEYGPANWNELHDIRDDTVIYRTRDELKDNQEGSGERGDDHINIANDI